MFPKMYRAWVNEYSYGIKILVISFVIMIGIVVGVYWIALRGGVRTFIDHLILWLIIFFLFCK